MERKVYLNIGGDESVELDFQDGIMAFGILREGSVFMGCGVGRYKVSRTITLTCDIPYLEPEGQALPPQPTARAVKAHLDGKTPGTDGDQHD